MARQQLQATLAVRFFCTADGNEPVREWLKALEPGERKAIGEEIRTVQLGWPLGMPLVRKMSRDLWEIRVTLPTRIARVFFTVVDDAMVLLHGFIKKSPATSPDDLDVARSRLKAVSNAKQWSTT
ncbi:type II toxin-antitoxin system RelE/ParE family toxin [Burkholderia sp. Bp9002]|nr:type II toxin-antitoxin system RelE/ParE family toxin [Burkholderia sp. Bp9002]